MISSAARDRVKLAVDQLEEAFHRYDERSTDDSLAVLRGLRERAA